MNPDTCPCTDDKGVVIWPLLWSCDDCPLDKKKIFEDERRNKSAG